MRKVRLAAAIRGSANPAPWTTIIHRHDVRLTARRRQQPMGAAIQSRRGTRYPVRIDISNAAIGLSPPVSARISRRHRHRGRAPWRAGRDSLAGANHAWTHFGRTHATLLGDRLGADRSFVSRLSARPISLPWEEINVPAQEDS